MNDEDPVYIGILQQVMRDFSAALSLSEQQALRAPLEARCQQFADAARSQIVELAATNARAANDGVDMVVRRAHVLDDTFRVWSLLHQQWPQVRVSFVDSEEQGEGEGTLQQGQHLNIVH